VLGPNGAGKSTLFRCILRFLKNYHGRISIDDADIRSFSRREMAKRIAYIPQSSNPAFNYTVLDIALMGLTHEVNLLSSPGKEHVLRAEQAIESLGIGNLRDRGFSELSGGERQLALIARALVQRSNILIMDEPTANLDYGNQCRVMKKIAELASQGYIVILSTHNPEHAFLYVDRAIMLDDGCLIADGAPDTVLTEQLIRKVYGVDVLLHVIDAGGKRSKVCVPINF
jgi:iron complex transport system ATP-binding protein